MAAVEFFKRALRAPKKAGTATGMARFLRNKKRRREQVKSAKALDLLRAAGAAPTSKKKRLPRKKNEVLCVGAEREKGNEK